MVLYLSVNGPRVTANPIIALKSVSKAFRLRRRLTDLVSFKPRKVVWALAGVDLEVNPREVVCVLGRNGAGKTTLLKVIDGIILPNYGSVVFPRGDGGHGVGFVAGDERGFYWRLSGYENLRFFAYFWGLSGDKARTRVEELLDVVGIADRAGDEVRTYSSGMKQRLAIARALLPDPCLLLIDELSRSIDFPGALDLARFISNLVRAGDNRAAIVATHQIWVAREIATRIVVLDGGRIVAEGTPASLLGDVGDIRFNVYVDTPPHEVEARVLPVLPAEVKPEGKGSMVSFSSPAMGTLSAVFKVLASFNILNVTRDGGEVSDTFLRLLRGVADE